MEYRKLGNSELSVSAITLVRGPQAAGCGVQPIEMMQSKPFEHPTT